ncbi:MAG: protein CrdC [Myxococcaceae bacterium]|nr:protein CrdC [Myxococcaceae bacterium]
MTQVEGLVLARVAEHRLAFLASAVSVVERWRDEALPVTQARLLFGLPFAPGRILKADRYAVAVDSLEIFREPITVMPVPMVLTHALSGALLGFVTVVNELWPLLDVLGLARALAQWGAA